MLKCKKIAFILNIFAYICYDIPGMINSITFGAHYIDSVHVLKKVQNTTKYEEQIASIIEIDSSNLSDLAALDKINTSWKGNHYCTLISHFAQKKRSKPDKILALTTQSTDLDKLKPEQILGVMNARITPEHTKLLYLESKYPGKQEGKEYERVGESFVGFIKTLTKKITLFCPNKDIIDGFYIKLDFQHIYPNSTDVIEFDQLIWEEKENILTKLQKAFRKI